MSTSSTNICDQYRAWGSGLRPPAASGRLGDRDDGDLAAVLAVVFEADFAFNLGVERVVLAEPDIEAGIEAPPFLTDQDRAAGDNVAVVSFYPEPLRIAVAAVA